MNDTTTKEVAPARPHKSKRLSSLVWIVVLWGFVRLIAEMDGISWKRSFWSDAQWLAAMPATFLLIIAFGLADRWFTRWLVYSALLLVLLSFFSFFLFVETLSKDIWFVFSLCQTAAVFIVLVSIFICGGYMNRKGGTDD